MTRLLYQWLLWLHPPFFRREFAGEMLWIFDSSVAAEGAPALLFDGVASLARQWLLRSGSWKIAAALAGGLVQITLGGFGMMIFGHRQSVQFLVTAPYAGVWSGSLRSPAGSTPVELALGRNRGEWLGSLVVDGPDGRAQSDLLDIRVRRDLVTFRIATPAGDTHFHGRLNGETLSGDFESSGDVGSGRWELARASPSAVPRGAAVATGIDNLVAITICLVACIILAVVLLSLWTRSFTHQRIHSVR
jgi:hypothetical protein